MGSNIKVLLADDHEMLRAGIEFILGKTDGFDVVGSAASVEGVYDLYCETSPDVVLCDIRFGNFVDASHDEEGFALLRRIIDFDQAARVVMFTQFHDIKYIQRAYALGAKGYLTKDTETGEILKALVTVSRGDVYFNDGIAKRIAEQSFIDENNPTPDTALDERQLEVFKLIAQGFTQEEISIELKTSKRTVTHITKQIKECLGIEKGAEFTVLAIKHDLIKTSDFNKLV